MTTLDRPSEHAQYDEESEIPKMALAEPRSATLDRQGEDSDWSTERSEPSQPEPSSETSLFADDELPGLHAREATEANW